jgi:hypothetical protein
MLEKDSSDNKYPEPLSTATRKAKRNMMGISTLALIYKYGGLVPTEITNLGITLSETHLRNIKILFALTILYFIVTFVAWGLKDYFAWLSYIESEFKYYNWKRIKEVYKVHKRISYIVRVWLTHNAFCFCITMLEFQFPLIFAFFAISSVLLA